MKKLKLPGWSLLLLIGLVLIFPAPTLAVSEFLTNYQVVYQVHSSGLTTVTQNVSLTNQASHVYAAEYRLSTSSDQIQGVRAWDGLGPITASLEESLGVKTVRLVFNEKVVGKDKTLRFGLEYETPELAIAKGQTWELRLPKLAEPETIDQYQLILKVPAGFGQAAYILPQPDQTQPLTYIFNKNAAAKGIIALFGNFQVFDFKISYPLTNKNSQKQAFSVALPPDTASQKVVYQRLTPEPENVLVDFDGNWLARYQLAAGESILVEIQGTAQVFLEPVSRQAGPLPDDLSQYLQPQPYWPVDHPRIQELAQRLKTPLAIYRFVVDTLSYDYDRIGQAERLGALRVLDHPEMALCMEFTDLFITLARASGLAAREINGYAQTENPRLQPLSLEQDILHSWPEYWDSQAEVWRSVDPTWEKTTAGIDYFHKLDLDHLAFVIHGQDSQRPAAPGSGPEKNVEVVFGSQPLKLRENLTAVFAFPDQVLSGRPVSGQVTIKNTGNVSLNQLQLLINDQPEEIEILAPFGQQTLTYTLAQVPWWQTKKEKIIVRLNGYSFEKEVVFRPFFLSFTDFLLKLIK